MSETAASSGGRVSEGMAALSRKDNVVHGTVGPAWSDNELRKNAFGMVCGGFGETVTDLVIDRKSDGSADISARCVL